jgi:hypothetical protein
MRLLNINNAVESSYRPTFMQRAACVRPASTWLRYPATDAWLAHDSTEWCSARLGVGGQKGSEREWRIRLPQHVFFSRAHRLSVIRVATATVVKLNRVASLLRVADEYDETSRMQHRAVSTRAPVPRLVWIVPSADRVT